MGEVIRKQAAAEAIFADAEITRLRADARAGYWKEHSDERLVPLLTVSGEIKAQLDELLKLIAAHWAKVHATDDVADLVLGASRDTIFNEMGRRAHDPHFVLLFPDGLKGYTENDTLGQPARMGVLVELLKKGVYAGLSKETADTLAAKIEEAQNKLQAAVDDLVPLLAKKDSLESTYRALARATQMALVNVKRLWRAEGETEVTIHEVIPDRS